MPTTKPDSMVDILDALLKSKDNNS